MGDGGVNARNGEAADDVGVIPETEMDRFPRTDLETADVRDARNKALLLVPLL